MKVCGLDLAGLPKNPSGFCVLVDEDGVKTVRVKILFSDDEIVRELDDASPDVVALDAPATFSGHNRACDRELEQYGALPVTLPGMEVLARRGTNLAGRIAGKHKLVEVYAKASAKILGVYAKDDFACQKKLLSLDLSGDPNQRMLTRDELDAVFAAMTGYLHLMGQTKEVGDEDGRIIIPDV
ncbi:MAG: hypothetical protein ABH834_01035 [Candidatus Altiarchaeota archaeon]